MSRSCCERVALWVLGKENLETRLEPVTSAEYKVFDAAPETLHGSKRILRGGGDW
jgi:hypothetical protein